VALFDIIVLCLLFCVPSSQGLFELEVAEKNQHPSIIGARLMFVVWIRPEDLLGPKHSQDFETPGKKCLLLVQEMDAIAGKTMRMVIDEVNITSYP
jgi:hypothetical protein